jgi:hypothetical protein
MPTFETETPNPFATAAAGYLLTPLAWVRDELAPLLGREPELALHVLTLDRARMHVVAFALAHTPGPVTPAFVHAILTVPRRTVLSATLGTVPAGLRGVFDRMPYRVLPRETYVRLASLFADHRTAKLLAHAEAVDVSLIGLLSALPPTLHSSALVRLGERCSMLDGLPESLAFLAARGAVPDLEALVGRLGRCRSPREFASLIRTAADTLPLPASLPPAGIGPAARVDDPVALRDLARRWKNCLANFVGLINDGECAFYVWNGDGIEAGCMLRRRGRLGWFVDDIKGPRNEEPAPEAMATIIATFADAGIPMMSVAELIDDIGGLAENLRRRGPGRRAVYEAEDVEIPDDDAEGAPAGYPHDGVDWHVIDDLACVNAWQDETPMAQAA